jgi:hypothetical protein
VPAKLNRRWSVWTCGVALVVGAGVMPGGGAKERLRAGRDPYEGGVPRAPGGPVPGGPVPLDLGALGRRGGRFRRPPAPVRRRREGGGSGLDPSALAPAAGSTDWLTDTHDYAGTRYSPLDQIDTTNAAGLGPR